MSLKPPPNPLVVIIGATGTGKSQLAVALAGAHNGEIINADAMQMYVGLPIITNKIPAVEQGGIPHHLLGVVGLDEEPWRVDVFKRKAESVIEEIRGRGKLPILVGGTHYYLQGLLLDEGLVKLTGGKKPAENGQTEGEELGGMGESISREELNKKFPILTKPTEEILQRLTEVDPIMAKRWHPNDRTKIQRSLEIWLMTGKQASKVYEEQKNRKRQQKLDNETSGEKASLLQSALIFWVHAEKEVLKSRLNKRVENMVSTGLIDELSLLDNSLEMQTAAGGKVDRSSGIWVSIGLKEFEPYLTAKKHFSSISNSETALAASIERTKSATRQYAKRQVQWIRNKLLPALSGAKALNNFYLLDGSDLSKWTEAVSNPALDIVRRFVGREELPLPARMSQAARDLLVPKHDYDFSDRRDLWIREECSICHMTAVTEEQWQVHLKSRKHRRILRQKNKGDYKDRPGEMTLDGSEQEIG